MPQRGLLPGQYKAEFHPRHGRPRAALVTSDGAPAHDYLREDSMLQFTTYHGTLERLDGEWTLHLEWVDPDLGGHRFVLPDPVVAAILRGAGGILKRSRSDRATHAAATRRQRQQERDDEEGGGT